MQSPSSWRALVRSLLAVLLYAAAVVWSSISPSAWTVVVVAFPLIALAGSQALSDWKKTGAHLVKRLRGFASLALLLLALMLLKPLLLQNFQWIYLLQHSGIHLALAWVFGSSLKAGTEPLCTRFARLVHPADTMTEEVLDYTRQVTVIWTLFFLLIGISSPIIMGLCTLPVWTVFSTFVTMGLTGTMFAVEAIVRRYALPNSYRASFVSTWQAVERHFRKGHAS